MLKSALEPRQTRAFVKPARLRRNVPSDRTVLDQFIAKAGKPTLKNTCPAHEQSVGVPTLGHAFAVFAERRKHIPFKQRNPFIVVG
jgi:hypothetical protein